MGLAMATEKKPTEKKPAADEKKPNDLEFTTVRLRTVDGGQLSDLAKLSGETAAEVYEKHCAPIIKELLRKELTARMKSLN